MPRGILAARMLSTRQSRSVNTKSASAGSPKTFHMPYPRREVTVRCGLSQRLHPLLDCAHESDRNGNPRSLAPGRVLAAPVDGSGSSLVLEDAERFAALFAGGRVPTRRS